MYGIDCTPNTSKAVQSEIDSIGRYLDKRIADPTNTDTTLTRVIQHSSGFFYYIVEAGASAKPETCSTINIDYKGRRFGGPSVEGTIFDTGTGSSLAVYNLIAGWQQGLPLIGAGGKIHLYIPPSLAYGAAGNGTVKGNTFLFFEITLNSFY